MAYAAFRARLRNSFRRDPATSASISSTLRALAQRDGDVAQASVYRVSSDFELPPGFDLSAWKGLFHCEVVRAGADRHFLAFWRAQHIAEHLEPELVRRLGLGSRVCGGAVVDARARSISLRPRSLGDTVVWIAAVVGAWTALSAAWLSLFGRPEVELSPPLGTLNVAAQRDFHVQFGITNKSPSSNARVEIASAKVGGSGGRDLLPVESFFSIAPGEREQATLNGRLDQIGSMTIEVEVLATAGKWYLYPPRPRLTIPVRVWPRWDLSTFELEEIRGNLAYLRATMVVGQPAARQFTCEAWTTGLGDTQVMDVLPRERSETNYAATRPGREVASIKWDTPLLEPFTTNTVRLVLVGKKPFVVSPDQIARQAAWDCEEKP